MIEFRRLTRPEGGRRQRFGYWLAAAIIALGLFSSGVPSPLYSVYRQLWGFSPLVLTLIYATYAFGVLASLLLLGRISDEVGRRPVLITALAALLVSSIIFMAAGSVSALFVARALQGLATGAALSAASAALLDFHHRRDAASVGLTNGVAGTAGMGLGVLASALLVALGPLPLVAPYALLMVLTLAALVGVVFMPEPVPHRARLRLTPQRPSLPARTRRPFRLAALGVLSSWSIAGLFFSLGPQLATTLFHSSSKLLGGFCIFLLAISGASSQLVFRKVAPWRGAMLGSVALAAGMLLVTASAVSGSSPLYLAGTVIGGAGYGVAFSGGLRTLSAAIPQEHRAAIMSAFYIACYGSLSVPAIIAGAAVTPLGLRPTFAIFGAVVALLALGVALEARRFRPSAKAAAASAA